MTADWSDVLERRGLSVPTEDAEPLAEYWAHLRHLRADVNETQLADKDIALTWTAVSGAD